MKYAVVPAAGLATRFLPASKTVPKELFPLFDRPAIQHIVEEAITAGSSDVVFVTGQGKEAILDHFDRTNPKFPLEKLSSEIKEKISDLDTSIDVMSIRQKHPKGLGHAVLTGCKLVGNNPFSVLLPDVFIYSVGKASAMEKMMKLHKEEDASVILLMNVPDEDREKYGMAEGEIVNGVMNIERLVEKPGINGTESNMAIVGRYIFNPSIIDLLRNTKPGAKGEIQLTDAINEQCTNEKVLGLVLDRDDIVFDTGDKAGYALANAFLASRHIEGFKDSLAKLMER